MFHVTERLLLRPARRKMPKRFSAVSRTKVWSVIWRVRRGPTAAKMRRPSSCALSAIVSRFSSPAVPARRVHRHRSEWRLGARRCRTRLLDSPPYWGRGFATEATRAVIEIARLLGHARLSAGHFADNPASGRVLRKAGFKPTGQIAKRHSCGKAVQPIV